MIEVIVLVLISITSVLGFTCGEGGVICDSSSIITNIAGDNFFCEEGLYWTNSEGTYGILPVGTYTCFQNPEDVAQGSSETCCPAGSRCGIDSGEVDEYGKCVQAAEIYCWEYGDDEEACNRDVSNVGARTVEYAMEDDGFCNRIIEWADGDVDCYDQIICGCSWDDSMDDGEKCVGNWTQDFINCNPDEDGGCTMGRGNVIDNCDTDGEMIISWVATPFGSYVGMDPNPCVSETKTHLCSMIELPFFNIFNFLVSVGILFVIYCFILKRLE